VGKSGLAVHIAHLLADRFPDRQLFVDLHAHTASRAPADPAATLAGLLTGDGLDPRQLPTGLAELAALWRARMAGRRVLLVLDNAASSAQISPLLPGGKGSLVLVTSRRHLGDLPYAVTEVLMDVLPPGDAAAMFLRLAPRTAGAGMVPPAGTGPDGTTPAPRLRGNGPASPMVVVFMRPCSLPALRWPRRRSPAVFAALLLPACAGMAPTCRYESRSGACAPRACAGMVLPFGV